MCPEHGAGTTLHCRSLPSPQRSTPRNHRPYFAYLSSLHLYESLGWWRRSAEVRRVHFAEEWNEFHHLLTMEALGGDQVCSGNEFHCLLTPWR